MYWSGTTDFRSNTQLFLTDFKSTGEESLRTLYFSNRESWTKYFGQDLRDHVTIQGGGFYRSANDGTHNYSLDLSGSFTKLLYVSDRFSNTLNGGAGIARSDQSTSHAEGVSHDLSYHLSRIFLFSNTISAANTNDGNSVSASFLLSTKTRIVAAADYIFTLYSVPDGRTTLQNIDLTVSGPLSENFNFSTQAHFRVLDLNTTIESREKEWDVRADLYWYLYGYSINLGASYLNLNTTPGISGNIFDITVSPLFNMGTSRTTTTTIYGGISKAISRKLFASVIGSYLKNKFSNSGSSSTVLQVHPMLGFYWRQLIVTAEYIYTRENGTSAEIDLGTKTDHRLILRLTRTFQTRFGGR